LAAFKSAPADLSRLRDAGQYAPPARDATLRRAQDEDALEHQIWLLALSEAYGARNLGWMRAMTGRSRPEIVADYYKRHPAMERFSKRHIEAGTCADAVRALREESERRKAGAEADAAASGRPRPPQEAVTTWICDYYAAAHQEGRPPPKRAEDAFPTCRKMIGATDDQIREAMHAVPRENKRRRGERDR
jgi:hypothetical protein